MRQPGLCIMISATKSVDFDWQVIIHHFEDKVNKRAHRSNDEEAEENMLGKAMER